MSVFTSCCLLWHRWWGCSSFGRPLDRHAADAGSIPRCGKGFFSPSQLSVQTLLRCVRAPPLCNCMHLHLCARLRSRNPCQSSVDYRNTKTPSMHRRLGRATLSQPAFPGEGNPNFLWEKSHWDNTVVKEKSKRSSVTRWQLVLFPLTSRLLFLSIYWKKTGPASQQLPNYRPISSLPALPKPVEKPFSIDLKTFWNQTTFTAHSILHGAEEIVLKMFLPVSSVNYWLKWTTRGSPCLRWWPVGRLSHHWSWDSLRTVLVVL